jgi:hypothetical protein
MMTLPSLVLSRHELRRKKKYERRSASIGHSVEEKMEEDLSDETRCSISFSGRKKLQLVYEFKIWNKSGCSSVGLGKKNPLKLTATQFVPDKKGSPERSSRKT